MSQELLISASKESGFDVWDFASGQHIKAISAAKCNGNTTLLSEPCTLLYPDLAKTYVHTIPVPVNASVSTTTSSSNSLPYTLSTVCADSTSGYFAGGSLSNGGCLLWDSNGNLCAQWNAHYKPISAMAFTGDGVFLCTGGEDAIIHVWLVADIVSSGISSNSASSFSNSSFTTAFKPFTSFSSHTLAITSFFSSFSYMNFLFSSSKDNSVRLHNISSKITLLTLLLPASIASVVVDSEQRSAFAACSNGNVYQIDLHKALRPMNTTGSTFATSMNALSTPSTAMPGHSQAVLSVKLSFDGSLLASASLDGTIRIWDTTTLTCIRTLSRTNRLSFNSLVTVRLPCVQSTRKRVEERGIIRGKTTQKRDIINVGGCDERIGAPMQIGESQRFENVMNDVKNEWSNLFCKASPKNSSNIPSVSTNATTLQQWQEAALQLYSTSLQHIIQHSAEPK